MLTLRKMLKKIEKIEREFGSLENFAISTTFCDEQHTMKIDEHIFAQQSLMAVYQDLNDLETADLVDFQKFGKANGNFY